MVAQIKDGRLRARFRLAVHDSLLEAAERSIVEDGVEGASLLSIAKRAGVAVGTIYNHFQDRQELFHELFTKRKGELVSEVDAAMKTPSKSSSRASPSCFWVIGTRAASSCASCSRPSRCASR
jgi:AcrR family transcriptional regulator